MDEAEDTIVTAGEVCRQRQQQAEQASPCLVALVGSAAVIGRHWPLGPGENLVGRMRDCQVFIDDLSISRRHASIAVASGRYTIADLGSTNRTLLNNRELKLDEKVEIFDNDHIRCGDIILKFLRQGNVEIVYAEEVFNRSQTDPLTGLFNRKSIDVYGLETFGRAVSRQLPLSVIIFDVDGFKQVNDQLGHSAGDFVLKELARVMRAGPIRVQDFLGRFGGDEFVLIPYRSTLEQAIEIAERLRQSVAGHNFCYEHTTLSVTISVGLATRQSGDLSWEAILERADKALYLSKQNGRNRISYY